MKVKNNPCEDNQHEFYPKYYYMIHCSADYCYGGGEAHCKKCGWYISECPCGCCNGADKVSSSSRKVLDRKRLEKEVMNMSVKLASSQEDIPKPFAEAKEDNFWDLVG